MTHEEKLNRARAKMERLREISKSNRRGADRMEWKPRAKIYLHPESELNDRLRVWFPKLIEEKEDKKAGKKAGKLVVNIPFNVPSDPAKCPFQLLRSIVKERTDLDPDEVILSVGQGRSKTEICRGEILQMEGYDYRKSLRPQADFVVAAIKIEDSKKKRPDKLKIEVLSGAKSLAAEIRKSIESEIDESGDEKGNPFFSPYPFIIEFDEQERGSDMYSARGRITETPDEEIQELLDADPPDLESEIELSDPKEMIAAINEALVRDDISIKLSDIGYDAADNSKAEPKREVKREASVKAEPKREEKVRTEVRAEPKREVRHEVKPVEPEPEVVPEEVTGEDTVEPPEEVAEEPEVKKSEPAKTAQKAEPKTGWTPGPNEDYDICPRCNNPVPVDAVACPHPGCGAKFAPESADPF